MASEAEGMMSDERKEADNFRESFDARDWAKGFVRRVALNPAIATDEGTMTTWFANALMRGYDFHASKQPIESAPSSSASVSLQERVLELEKALVESQLIFEALNISIEWELAPSVKAEIAKAVERNRAALSQKVTR